MKFPAQNLRRQLGQGMTEYIIIVALIAVAGISTFSFFGRTIQTQASAVASGLAGDETAANASIGDAATRAGDAKAEADRSKGMNNFEVNSASQ